MVKSILFMYDTTITPWHADIGRIMNMLEAVRAKGVACQIVDTHQISDEEWEEYRNKVYFTKRRQQYRIRNTFGSNRAGRLPFLGRQVPALLVYEEGKSIATVVYPREKTEGDKRIDVAIEDGLKELLRDC